MTNSDAFSAIEARLSSVNQRIESAQKLAPNAKPVTLVAVSKRHPVGAIEAAYNFGQRDFGENYLQEAIEKIEQLKDKNIHWHFIGPIQSNKTRAIATHFDWAHTIDRIKIAQRLSDQRPETLPALNVCIQVNIDDEDSKSGVSPESCPQLALEISKLPNLRLRGLMAIPANEEGTRAFERMYTLFNELSEHMPQCWDTLSMGMSADLEEAIANGANVVRIGTDIFGPRDSA